MIKRIERGIVTNVVIMLVAIVTLFGLQVKANNVYLSTNLNDNEVLLESVSGLNSETYHVFTHGKPGHLLIDQNWKTAEDLALFLEEKTAGYSSVNIYGCEFGKGEEGRSMVSFLEERLQKSISASDDITGVDGDWELEVGDKKSVRINHYNYNLQTSVNACTAEEVRGGSRYWALGFGTTVLDFGATGNSVPVVNTVPTRVTAETTTAISDVSGVLVGYYGSIKLLDASGNELGTSVNLGGAASSTQTTASIGFSTNRTESILLENNSETDQSRSISWTIFDFQTNTVVDDGTISGSNEMMLPVLSSTPDLIWVLTGTSSGVKAIEFGPTGPTGTVVNSSTSESPISYFGEMAVNANGTKIAFYTGGQGDKRIMIMDFNPSTGVATEKVVFDASTVMTDHVAYGLELSPSGDYVYASDYPTENELHRFDITNEVASVIETSAIDLGNVGISVFGINIGPDGRLWCSSTQGEALAYLDDPDSPVVSASDFKLLDISSNGGSTGMSRTTVGCPIQLSTPEPECTDPEKHEYNCDFDGDGILNVDDLDDDNDGILDETECPSSEIGFPLEDLVEANGGTLNSVAFNDYKCNSSGSIDIQPGYGGAVTPSLTAQSGAKYIGFHSNGYIDNGINTGLERYEDLNFEPDTPLLTGNTYEISFYAYVHDISTRDSDGLGALNVYGGSSKCEESVFIGQSKIISSSTEWGKYKITFIPTTDISHITFFPVGVTVKESYMLLDDFRIKEIGLNSAACDLDGDGISNQFDLDSDGDSCPDALEGGASFVYTDLEIDTSLGNAVDTDEASTSYGVPTLAGAGQAVGSSQDDQTQSDECDACNANSILYNDHDGDGIGDDCDLDDDNDGILDVDEMSRSFVQWPSDSSVDGSHGPANVVKDGVIVDTVSLTLDDYSVNSDTKINQDWSSLVGVSSVPGVDQLSSGSTYGSSIGYSTTTGVANSLTFGGSYNRIYLVTNYVSNRPETSYDFSSTVGLERITIIDQSATVKNLRIVGKEVLYDSTADNNSTNFGILLEGNNMSSIEWLATVSELADTNGFTVIIEDFLDTDGDGIPNHQDLDSDNDGCPDALEGDGSLVYGDLDTDTSLGDTVEETDATKLGVPTVAGSGQAIGSSQDENTQSDECDTCNSNSSLFKDTDGDTIGDYCDLDDDNDGILDVAELDCLWTPDNVVASSAWSNGASTADPIRTIDGSLLSSESINATHGTSRGVLPQGFLWGSADYSGTIDFEYTTAVDMVRVAIWNNTVSNGADAGFREFRLEITHSAGVYRSGVLMTKQPQVVDDNKEAQVFELPYKLLGVTNVRLEVLNGWLKDGSEWKVHTDPTVSQQGYEIYIGEFRGVCELDTDGDGIPNHQDLDSDNDGCPDALEGGASFVYTDLDSEMSLGDTVEETDATKLGVPTAAGSGQAIGSSQDDQTKADECDSCNATSTLFVDTDGDTIGDDCDLDDDNDGILDTVECVFEDDEDSWFWNVLPIDFGFTGGTSITNSLNGTADVSSTFSLPAGSVIVEVIDANMRNTSFAVGNSGQNRLKVKVSGTVPMRMGVTHQTKYSEGLIRKGFVARGEGAYELYWPISSSDFVLGDTGSNYYIDKLTSGVLNQASRWESALSEKYVEFYSTEPGTDFNEDNGVSISLARYCPDTDNDGIINSLDLDSDGDGCPDALEGDGGYVFTDLFEDTNIDGGNNNDGTVAAYTGLVTEAVQHNLGKDSNSDGTVDVLGDDEVTINESQSDVSSTDGSILSDACNCDPSFQGVIDTDGDGVGDYCDLDDDNDGILDLEECPELGVSFDVNNEDWKYDISPFALNSVDGDVEHSTSDTWNGSCSNVVAPSPTGTSFVGMFDTGGNTTWLQNTNPFNVDISKSIGGKLEFYINNGTTSGTGDIGGVTKKILLHGGGSRVEGSFSLAINVGWQKIEIDLDDASWTGTASDLETVLGNLEYIRIDVENVIGRAYGDTGGCSVAEYFALDDIKFSYTCDTDADGLIDSLDLDSDGDGCPDALEGDGGFTTSDLVEDTNMDGGNNSDGTFASYLGVVTDGVQQNLGNSDVNVDGTINADGDAATTESQSDVSAYDSSEISNACSCIAGLPGVIDTDGDGVADPCDLDDDNDGIRDDLECPIAEIKSVAISTALVNVLESNGSGTFVLDPSGEADLPSGGVDISASGVTSSNTFAVYSPPVTTSNFTIDGFEASIPTAYIDIINNPDGVVLDIDFGATSNTLNKTVDDFHHEYFIGVAGLAGLGGTKNGVVTFSEDLEFLANDDVFGTNLYSVFNGTNTLTATGSRANGYTYFRVPRDIETLTYSVVNNDWHGVNIGVISKDIRCDTDGDLIPNIHDLDSDGDGCPDSLESDILRGYLTNGTLPDGVAATDATFSNGQVEIGTSAGVGANGLDDDLEDVAESGTYKSSVFKGGVNLYSSNALDDTINIACGAPCLIVNPVLIREVYESNL